MSNLISSNEIDMKPRFTSSLATRTVDLNERVTFSCEFYSQTQITSIKWYHNGLYIDTIVANSRYVINNEANRASLFILSVNYEDDGYYEVRVENAYGYSITGAKLEVRKGKKIFLNLNIKN